jgi:nicotinamide-nucleotide amidase
VSRERPRAVAVITGSELVRGELNDANGPFLARELLGLGFEPSRITIVGDQPEELEAALREGVAAPLCVVSGGLGPTHDDRTVELVAKALGLELYLDKALEEEIGGISRTFAERMGRSYDEFAPGVIKQATLPVGAFSLGLAGTAPAFVLGHDRGAVVVLPGPPRELQTLWPRALGTEPVSRALGQAVAPGRRVARFFGVSESAVAEALRTAGGDGNGVEATICARDFEIRVDLVVDEHADEQAEALLGRLREPITEFFFTDDDRKVEEHVLDLMRERGLKLATAESCTGGLVSSRLVSIPGSSAVFLGGVVSYANAVKQEALGVPAELLDTYGSVSPEVARAMAEGARERLGADVAVSVTGVAGPTGGTPEKPVGLVYLHAVGPDGSLAYDFLIPRDRDLIRGFAATSALHLVRRLLTQS